MRDILLALALSFAAGAIFMHTIHSIVLPRVFG